MKQSSFYHLLLTLGVFLLIVIYPPLESFAISEALSDSSKPEGTDAGSVVFRPFHQSVHRQPDDRLSFSEAQIPPEPPSTQDEKIVRAALAKIGLRGQYRERRLSNGGNQNNGPLQLDTTNGGVAERDCNEAEKLYSNGLALADNSDKEAQFYLKAIELCQDFSEAHNKLGEIYKSRGEYDSAINEFTRASRRWHFVEPLINLGEIYRMQGHYDLAAKELIEAVRIQPDSREAWNQLKYIRKRLGEYDSFSVTPPEPTPTAIFTRVPGMTLPKGTWEIDLVYNYWKERSLLTRDLIISTGRPFLAQGATRREREVNLWILGLGYGLTDNFTINVRPRYSIRYTHFQGSTPQVSGLGDTNLLMKYHLWGQRRTHISLFHLLGIPTGDENATDIIANNSGNRSTGPPETAVFNIPLGSGSYSYTPGIAITMENKPVAIQTNISYLFSDSTRVADEFRWDLAFIFPKFHDFESMLELNYRRTETLTGPRLLSDVVLKEPGGQTLFLSPGVQISLPQGYMLELGFQLPVIKPPEEVWLEDTIFHLGLTKFFFSF